MADEPAVASPARPRRRGGSASLDEVTPAAPPATENQPGPAAPAAPPVAPGGPGKAERPLPALPTSKTSTSGILEEKTVLLYGPAGIGKSTLASEWAGGEMFFFDCAGELSDLEVYRGACTDWTTFLEWAAAYKAGMESDTPPYRGAVIDTADLWGMFCAQSARRKLGIVHESDAEWGKGWAAVKEQALLALAKLAAMPGGLIIVSHAKDVEIKARNQVYDRAVPTLTGGIREACVNMADLVLHVDWHDDNEGRVIHTKPDKYYEAKERGQVPRLPATIDWPIGQSGYEVLRSAWYAADSNSTKST